MKCYFTLITLLILKVQIGLVFGATTQGLDNNKIVNVQIDTFVIIHTFETDAKTLFNMWIDPKIYTSWMGPAGANMSFIKANVREGGSSHWVMTTPDGLTKYGQLHYKIINPNHLIIYVQNFCDKEGNFTKAPFSKTYPDRLLLTVNFIEDSDVRVKMIVKWEIFGDATEIERKTFNDIKPFMVKGWSESFNKIEAILKETTNR
jgi:uncharacterized protein YndB with AHSA1/START domain